MKNLLLLLFFSVFVCACGNAPEKVPAAKTQPVDTVISKSDSLLLKQTRDSLKAQLKNDTAVVFETLNDSDIIVRALGDVITFDKDSGWIFTDASYLSGPEIARVETLESEAFRAGNDSLYVISLSGKDQYRNCNWIRLYADVLLHYTGGKWQVISAGLDFHSGTFSQTFFSRGPYLIRKSRSEGSYCLGQFSIYDYYSIYLEGSLIQDILVTANENNGASDCFINDGNDPEWTCRCYDRSDSATIRYDDKKQLLFFVNESVYTEFLGPSCSDTAKTTTKETFAFYKTYHAPVLKTKTENGKKARLLFLSDADFLKAAKDSFKRRK